MFVHPHLHLEPLPDERHLVRPVPGNITQYSAVQWSTGAPRTWPSGTSPAPARSLPRSSWRLLSCWAWPGPWWWRGRAAAPPSWCLSSSRGDQGLLHQTHSVRANTATSNTADCCLINVGAVMILCRFQVTFSHESSMSHSSQLWLTICSLSKFFITIIIIHYWCIMTACDC